MAHHRHHHHRRRNPFAAASMNAIAVKVAGGLGGGIAAGVVPNMILPSFASGWPGVLSAGVVAFGGSMLLRRMSSNASEGWLIGGLLQTAGRVAQLLIGKNLVSFSLSGYGPLQFQLPVPAYSGAATMVPAGPAVAKAPGSGKLAVVSTLSGNPIGYGQTRGKFDKFAA